MSNNLNKVFVCLLGMSVFLVCDSIPTTSPDADWMDNRLIQDHNKKEIRRLAELRQEVVDNGCDTNICFALDGSDFVSRKEYQAQKDFVDLIIGITATDKPANFCAVQYHSKTQTISRLTGNRDKFVKRLHSSKRRGGVRDIDAGIRFPVNQLRWRDGDAKKIVILGKNISNVGSQSKKMARQFRRKGGDFCAVTVGSSDFAGLTEITGEPGRVVNLDGFFELSEVIVNVVEDVCGLGKSSSVGIRQSTNGSNSALEME